MRFGHRRRWMLAACLSNTLPALGLYYTIDRSYNKSMVSKPIVPITSFASATPDRDIPSPSGSPNTTTLSHGDNPQTVKIRLRQRVQVVARGYIRAHADGDGDNEVARIISLSSSPKRGWIHLLMWVVIGL